MLTLSPVRAKNIISSTSFISALGSTETPTQWVAGAIFPEMKQPGHLQLAPRPRTCGSTNPLSHMPLSSSAGTIYWFRKTLLQVGWLRYHILHFIEGVIRMRLGSLSEMLCFFFSSPPKCRYNLNHVTATSG
jgi:hypothetical protein